jgi:hypothetical protein
MAIPFVLGFVRPPQMAGGSFGIEHRPVAGVRT